jgi:hypothetical protein
VTRKITELEKITKISQMKVGEYYTVGNGRDTPSTLVKCIYIDLFGQPVILADGDRKCVPVILNEGKTIEDYYFKHRGITHVKVEEPQSGVCWIVTYINQQGTIFSFTTPKPDAYTVGGRDGTCTILSVKKVQWTEGENDYDASE